MARTFQHRITIGELSGILLLAFAILYCFWYKSLPLVGMGFVLLCVMVRCLDRALHTYYLFTDDGQLVTRHGRWQISKACIKLDTITEVRLMPRRLLTPSYVLVTYGEGRMRDFTPADEVTFINYLRKRILESKQNKND